MSRQATASKVIATDGKLRFHPGHEKADLAEVVSE
jgi:hypothetical protein